MSPSEPSVAEAGAPGRPQPPGTPAPPTVQFCVRTMRPGLTEPSGEASIQEGLKTWPKAELPPIHDSTGLGSTSVWTAR